MAAAVVGTASVIMTLSILFWIPFAYAKVVKKDYSTSWTCLGGLTATYLVHVALRWYHFFLGPLLWRREAPADAGNLSAVPDYRVNRKEEPEGNLSAPS